MTFPRRVQTASAIAILCLWALFLYRPWHAAALGLVDMPALISAMEGQPDFPARVAALLDMHRAEGRFAPVSMGLMAAGWTWFGGDGAGWAWMRYVIMCAVVAAVFLLLRHLQMSLSAAVLGAGLFVASNASMQGWFMPQVGEPVAVLLLAFAAAMATGTLASNRRMARAVVAGLALALAVQVKEPVIAAVPFVLLLRMCWRGDGFGWPRFDREAMTFALVVSLVVALMAVAPVLLIRQEAASYGGQYDVALVTLGKLQANTLNSLLPVTRVLLFPANVVFLGVVALGLALQLRRRTPTGFAAPVVAVSLPLAIAVIYVPWPAFPGFYALPGLLGVALLLAWAIDVTRARSPRLGRVVVGGAAAALFAYGSVMAYNGVERYRAERRLDESLVRRLETSMPNGAIVLGVLEGVDQRTLSQSLMLTLKREDGGRPHRVVTEVPCGELLASLQSPTPVAATPILLPACASTNPGAGTRLVSRYRQIDWKTLRPRNETLYVLIPNAPWVAV